MWRRLPRAGVALAMDSPRLTGLLCWDKEEGAIHGLGQAGKASRRLQKDTY